MVFLEDQFLDDIKEKTEVSKAAFTDLEIRELIGQQQPEPNGGNTQMGAENI